MTSYHGTVRVPSEGDGKELRRRYIDRIPVKVHVEPEHKVRLLEALGLLGKSSVAEFPYPAEHTFRIMLQSQMSVSQLLRYLRTSWELPPEQGYYLTFGDEHAMPAGSMTLMEVDKLCRNFDDFILHCVLRKESVFG